MVAGSLKLTYTSTDASGKVGIATRNVNMFNTTDQVFTIIVASSSDVELGG